MKVLSVTPSYWPAFQFGGPITILHGLNRALVKRRVDVTVYTTDVGLRGRVATNQRVDLNGVGVHYFTYGTLLERCADTGWQFSRAMSKMLGRSMQNFDIVHAVGIWNFPTAAAAHHARKNHVPYIITPFGALYPDRVQSKGWKKRPYYALISGRDIRYAAALHYGTEDERNACHPTYGLANRAIVLPNGVEIPRPSERGRLRRRYPSLREKKIILFLGRMHQIKGLDILARSFGKLIRERSDVALLIVGPDEGGYERTIRDLLERDGVSDEVIFAGLLQGEEKSEAILGSDVFVLPSYSECFSMAVLEAMAFALPVIITQQCRFPEVARSGAGYVVHPNVDEITQALRELLDDPGLRRRMGETGRRLVQEKYSWDRIAGQMVDEYEKILKADR